MWQGTCRQQQGQSGKWLDVFLLFKVSYVMVYAVRDADLKAENTKWL
jgi:hypothetical protein